MSVSSIAINRISTLLTSEVYLITQKILLNFYHVAHFPNKLFSKKRNEDQRFISVIQKK